ncbi:M56 family metallopeptidase [Arthrobacter sp. VKM Ac-2550]|uniref:M56 family metallopeptidase n=1 Tax=Crystallibacter permensis TaxID=1938888 RepID=UPI00222610E4|nr:M56 family metallopeptidase [Arthrobacter sp. VKM Ac-2550]MCW2134143.1 Peptidase family M48 [Arthrobacter sp. VKM Ac-2550]
MTVPVVLVVFAIAAAVLGPRLLRRGDWLTRSPQMGIFTWQALSGSVLLSALLAGAALAVPALPATANLAEFLQSCLMLLKAQYSTPGGAAAGITGAILAVSVLARYGFCLARCMVSARSSRLEQLRALALVARRNDRYGVLVVDHPVAAAYCLPGRGRQIVLTTAALDALDEEQLSAVLAHERAHLRGRHDLVMAGAEALEQAFPRVPAFRAARLELARLIELQADDTAVRHYPRLTVASALVRLAEGGAAPASALGAGGQSALMRVRRLAAPLNPLGPGRRAAIALAAAVLLAGPVLLAAVPAAGIAHDYSCPTAALASHKDMAALGCLPAAQACPGEAARS